MDGRGDTKTGGAGGIESLNTWSLRFLIGLDFTDTIFLLRSPTGFFVAVSVDVEEGDADDADDSNDDVDAGEFVKRILPFRVLRVVVLVCPPEADVFLVVEEDSDAVVEISCFRIKGV